LFFIPSSCAQASLATNFNTRVPAAFSTFPDKWIKT
jgi:hypothetical protein